MAYMESAFMYNPGSTQNIPKDGVGSILRFCWYNIKLFCITGSAQ